MGTFSIWHWIIVLVIVVLVFGTKKLRNLGGDLGSAIKGFKDGMKESETESASQSTHTNDQIIEAEVRKEASVNTPASPSVNKAAAENSAFQSTSASGQMSDAEFKEKTQTKT